ncbi:MAG TPA: hypothetical protein VNM90_25325, partial [Haliangium sp.]|nr:hypothetical protein [Haliangium sp.]
GRCWGRNDQGMVGDGTYVNPRLSPREVDGLTNAVAIATTGTWSSCALIAGGDVRCWGGNNRGQLGTGSTDPYWNAPGDGVGLEDAVALESSTRGDTICAIRSNGAAACWGNNQQGQCGNGSSGSYLNEPVPVPVNELAGIAAIAPGELHTCALDASGAAWCWGNNGWGQIGIGSVYSSPPILTPASVHNFP